MTFKFELLEQLLIAPTSERKARSIVADIPDEYSSTRFSDEIINQRIIANILAVTSGKPALPWENMSADLEADIAGFVARMQTATETSLQQHSKSQLNFTSLEELLMSQIQASVQASYPTSELAVVDTFNYQLAMASERVFGDDEKMDFDQVIDRFMARRKKERVHDFWSFYNHAQPSWQNYITKPLDIPITILRDQLRNHFRDNFTTSLPSFALPHEKFTQPTIEGLQQLILSQLRNFDIAILFANIPFQNPQALEEQLTRTSLEDLLVQQSQIVDNFRRLSSLYAYVTDENFDSSFKNLAEITSKYFFKTPVKLQQLHDKMSEFNKEQGGDNKSKPEATNKLAQDKEGKLGYTGELDRLDKENSLAGLELDDSPSNYSSAVHTRKAVTTLLQGMREVAGLRLGKSANDLETANLNVASRAQSQDNLYKLLYDNPNYKKILADSLNSVEKITANNKQLATNSTKAKELPAYLRNRAPLQD